MILTKQHKIQSNKQLQFNFIHVEATNMNADGSKIIFFLGVAAAVVTAGMALYFSIR